MAFSGEPLTPTRVPRRVKRFCDAESETERREAVGPSTSKRASGEEESVGGERLRVEDWGMSIVGIADEGVAWIWRKRRAAQWCCNIRPEGRCLIRWLMFLRSIKVCGRMAGTLLGLGIFLLTCWSASTMAVDVISVEPAGLGLSF